MRLYREFSTWTGGVRAAVNPTALTVATSTVAGVAIEAPAAANDGAVGRYRVDTTDLLYTNLVVYRIAWTATIAGNTFTRTVRYRHVTPAAGTAPGAPAVGVYSVTDATATFTNVLGTNAVSTLITLTPADGGPAITGIGSGAFISVIGLNPSTTYNWSAQGVSATGAQSAITAGNLGTFITLPGPLTTNRIQVWWRFPFDAAGTWNANAPEHVDPAHTGPQGVGGLMGLGVGTDIEIMFRCYDPVPVCRVTSIFLQAQHLGPKPGGLRDQYGNP